MEFALLLCVSPTQIEALSALEMEYVVTIFVCAILASEVGIAKGQCSLCGKLAKHFKVNSIAFL